MSRVRFDKLEASFHISDPDIQGDCFSKLKPLNSHLLAISKALWLPGSALAIDEFMTRFTGRAKEKLIIPNQPIPTGIKGWSIAELGYFLHWIWHAKGSGPQGVKVPK